MSRYLFKPFEMIAGGPALVAGLFIIAVTAVLAWSAGLVTDGVLDLHFAPTANPGITLLQGLINWLSISLCLLLLGRWLSQGQFRTLDVFATQALARWPVLLGVGYLSIPWINQEINARTQALMAAMPDDPSMVMADSAYMLDAMWLTVLSLPLLVMLVWLIWLMYHGYALVTNLRGQRAVFSFIGGLIAAEILSKLLIWLLNLLT